MYSDGKTVWFVDLMVGQQLMGLRVDIAEPNFWVLNQTAFPQCSANETYYTTTTTATVSGTVTSLETTSYQCESYGAYNVSAAPSSSPTDELFDSVLIDYVTINGTVVVDDVVLFNQDNQYLTLKNFTFIDVNESNVVVGALGLGTPLYGALDTNVLNHLVEAGYINSPGYSMATEDKYSGQIVLGGVDTSLYTGPLVEFDNIPYQYSNEDIRYTYPIVPLSGITVNNDKGTSVWITSVGTVVPALLDSRTTYLYLPYADVVSLSVQLNAFLSSDSQNWFVKCSIGDVNGSVSFKFGNLTIDVPISELIKPIYDTNGTSVTFEDGSKACILTVLPDNSYGYSVLGTPVINALFIAVDNAGHKIALAQANNSNYKSLKSISTSTTTMSNSSSTSLPLSSSEIRPGYIPFAVTNNITDDLTFSYYFQTKSDSALELTAVFTSGQIYTGRASNSTSLFTASTSKSEGRTEAAGTKRYDARDNVGLLVGISGTLFALILGILA
jgi:hypothetical protein